MLQDDNACNKINHVYIKLNILLLLQLILCMYQKSINKHIPFI